MRLVRDGKRSFRVYRRFLAAVGRPWPFGERGRLLPLSLYPYSFFERRRARHTLAQRVSAGCVVYRTQSTGGAARVPYLRTKRSPRAVQYERKAQGHRGRISAPIVGLRYGHLQKAGYLCSFRRWDGRSPSSPDSDSPGVDIVEGGGNDQGKLVTMGQ